MELLGCDVSEHNGTLDVKRMEQAGIWFMILRTGFSDKTQGRADHRFEENYRKCEAAGMAKAAYHYLYSRSAASAVREAEHMLALLKNKKFEYPIYADFEDKTQRSLSPDVCVEIVYQFCAALEKAGYYTGWYTFLSLYDHMKAAKSFHKLARFDFWLAQWGSKKSMDVRMWQFADNGKISGSSANTDLNRCYFDYPSVIRKKGLNGWGKEAPAFGSASVTGIAKEVLEGKWGEGEERKSRLLKAGHPYEEIQRLINEKYRLPKKTVGEVAKEVWKGLWGNGEDRKERLLFAGYDYEEVQRRVEALG